MVDLGREEALGGIGPRDDGGLENMRLIELLDIGLGHMRLLPIYREDRRAVLGSSIRTLTVELSWIMGHREIDLQKAAIGYLVRIIGDLDGFRMARSSRTHGSILRGVFFASGIA